MTDILGFPEEQTAQLLEKIQFLLKEPLPDGKVKKKLVGKKDLFRLRVGNYRVIYTFGDTWIRLLGIRKRNERTYEGAGLQADGPGFVPDTDGDDDLEFDAPAPPRFTVSVGAASARANEPISTPLPCAITIARLKQLHIPMAHFAALMECSSEEALLAARVPADVLERMVDSLFPRSLAEVAQQPDLLVSEPEDLVRYRGGELFSFLLRLDDDQKKLVDWALKGPTMIKGGAGTGKSTVAMHRVKALLGRPGARATERVLFTTYTRALTAASQQLLKQLLTPAQMAQVEVSTVDELARKIVSSSRKLRRVEQDLPGILRKVRAGFAPSGQTAFERKGRAQALGQLSDRFILEEIEWVIEGRGLLSLGSYLEAPRPGRGIALRPGGRTALWELYELFSKELDLGKSETFSRLRSEALAMVRAGKWRGHYDYVLVDEAQDLPPVGLALLAEVATGPEGIFCAADEKQSIYSRNYSWAQAHARLSFTGRTAILRRNYRSTAEIDRAAFDLLLPEEGETLVESASVHSGPLPVLMRDVPDADTAAVVASFVRQMAKHLRMKLSTAAVLVPTADVGTRLATALERCGLPVKYFPGRELDLAADVVKVLTLHSAKGLEFPIVAICGFEAGTYPVAADFDDAGEFDEKMRHERRLLYVGMTRAMRGLLLVINDGCTLETFASLKPEHWHLGEH